MGKRHIHIASLAVRYADEGCPDPHPRILTGHVREKWASSPIAAAVAAQEETLSVAVRSLPTPPPSAAIHPGWFASYAED